MLFTSGFSLFGQGGSNYSIFGIGDLNLSSNASYEGLAGTQIAFPSVNSINLKNPAMWSMVTDTRLQAGYRFNQHLISDPNRSVSHNNGTITGFSTLFALSPKNGLSLSLGLAPYTLVNYYLASPVYIQEDGFTVTGNAEYLGKGGVSTLFAGLSSKVAYGLSIGVMGFAATGNIASEINTELFGDASYFTSTVTKEDQFKGAGVKFGFAYTGIKNLTLGGFYQSEIKSKGDRLTTYSTINPYRPDTTFSDAISFTVPSSLGFGASYVSGKFIFGADFAMQDYTGFDYKQGKNMEFSNSYMTSIGLSRIGNQNFSAPFMDKVTYKFGMSYREQYYKLDGNPINEISASVGLQIPWTRNLLTDVAFVMGRRGTTDNGLLQDVFGRFVVDISIGETWFVPFKRQWEK